MFRTTISRAAMATTQRSARAAIASRPAFASFVRYNSSKAPESSAAFDRKAALKKQDDQLRDWKAKKLTYEEVLPKSQSPSPDSYLIDVREPDETAQGMIPSAVNIPLSTLAESLQLPAPIFKQKFNFDKPKRDQEVIFYCRSGKRSASASDVAMRNGYTNVLDYSGSWLDWTEKQTPKSK